MTKKSNKLIFSLTKSYVMFLLIFLSIFIGSYLLLGYSVTKSINSRSIPIYNIINGNTKNLEDINYQDLTKINGFIEVLDTKMKIIKTIGEPNHFRTKYTESELIDAISRNTHDDKYNVFVNRCKYQDKEVTTLIWVPKGKFSYDVKLTKIPLSVGKQFYYAYMRVIFGAIILGTIGVIIYSFWMTKKIKKPLNKIDEALIKIIDGDYNQKLDVKGETEFVVIGNTINFLTDKLRESEEENKRLTESKSRMLMDLSHDIKTPITTIRGFSAALSAGLIDSDEQKERYFKTINSKAERVGELVDELFDFVRLENNSYELKLEKVDLSEFLRQILVDFIDELEERNFEVEINIPEEDIKYSIDVKMFKRVLTNIIENAIKYNHPGTKLRVELKETHEALIIEVADNGVGISEHDKNTIFDAFVRGDKSRSSDGGSGLGLSIAQKIVESHGGSIKLLEYTAKEKTVFQISLPIKGRTSC